MVLFFGAYDGQGLSRAPKVHRYRKHQQAWMYTIVEGNCVGSTGRGSSRQSKVNECIRTQTHTRAPNTSKGPRHASAETHARTHLPTSTTWPSLSTRARGELRRRRA